MRLLFSIILLAISLHSVAQDFTFKVRKVPKLKYFVFADGFKTHNLDQKSKIEEDFPLRMYLQVYENDTFLIRWSECKLSDANVELDYLKRDSLTFAGKLIRQGNDGMKFEFPFQEETFQMFVMSEDPLVSKYEYMIGPPNKRVERIKYSFLYNKKLIVLADLFKHEVDSHPEIDEALKLSARIKLGFYSSDLYSAKKVSADIPLNIVNTYPVHFILNNANNCDNKLYWKGVTQSMRFTLSDTSKFRKERGMISKMPEENIVSLEAEMVEYYKVRRYVFIENDSQIYVSNLNRGCYAILDTLKNLESIPIAEHWENRDGVNNYLVRIDKNKWGWASRYSCVVEWRVFEDKKIKKILELPAKKLFKLLNKAEYKGRVLLDASCD